MFLSVCCEPYLFRELSLVFDLRNACMQRQIGVAAKPVTVAAYVLCNCDGQWMVEAACSIQVLTSVFGVCFFYSIPQ